MSPAHDDLAHDDLAHDEAAHDEPDHEEPDHEEPAHDEPDPDGDPDAGGGSVDEAVAEAEALLESDLEALARERDEFRSLAQQVQADFENYRKRVIKQQTEHLERASEDLVSKLLPVLDACDAAIGHGAADVEPIYVSLVGILEKEGLGRIDAKDAPFDPNLHEAVAHEEGDPNAPVVAEVLRTGYSFKGRVLRPAMVKVSG